MAGEEQTPEKLVEGWTLVEDESRLSRKFRKLQGRPKAQVGP